MTTSVRSLVRRTSREGGDQGVTLIETVVALVVFALMATAALAGLVQMLSTSRGDRNRVQAADLAAAQLEITRDLPTSLIPDTPQTIQKTVNNTVFTISQTTEYVPDACATCTCDSAGSGLAYKRITETVTWPAMGGIAPVRTDGLRAINIGGLNPSTGQLSVKVSGGSQQAMAGMPVTLTNTSGYSVTQATGDDGCTVFVNVPVGSVTATTTRSGGYVDYNGNTTAGTLVSATTTISPQTLTRATIAYDLGGTLVSTVPTGTPSDVGITLKNSLLTANIIEPVCGVNGATSPHCVVQSTRQSVSLFPFSNGYLVWAGTCTDSDPGSSYYSASVSVPPGGTATTTLKMATVVVTKKTAGPVYAVHAADPAGGGCPSGENHLLGTTTAANQTLTVSLPYGSWYFGSQSNVLSGTATSLAPSAATPYAITVN